jgi:hypothetical protein
VLSAAVFRTGDFLQVAVARPESKSYPFRWAVSTWAGGRTSSLPPNAGQVTPLPNIPIELHAQTVTMQETAAALQASRAEPPRQLGLGGTIKIPKKRECAVPSELAVRVRRIDMATCLG